MYISDNKQLIEVDNSYNNIENWLVCEFNTLKKGNKFRVINQCQQLDKYAEIFECLSDCIFDTRLGWHCEIL